MAARPDDDAGRVTGHAAATAALADDARLVLAQLNAQAQAMRAEIERLRHVLSGLQGEIDGQLTAQLLEANEQMVLAAVQAQAFAETASSQLDALTHSSQHDTLTGTPNRMLMRDRMDSAIAMARRRGTRCALVFVDVDHFKQVNDSFGHGVGDEVLRQMAQRLASVLRASDSVSRHGGDEFLVLLSEVANAADAAEIAAKMQAALGAACVIGPHQLNLSASMGIATFPDDAEDVASLVRHADADMYRVKRQRDEPLGRGLRDANEQLLLAALRLHTQLAQARGADTGTDER